MMYEQYKNINLPWLNEIPYHWDIHRNKNIFTEMKEEVGTDSEQYRLLSLTLNGIIPRDMDGGGKFPGSFDTYKIVKPGYMAFCLFDVDETPRTVGLSDYDGMLTGAYTIMKVHDVNARYVYYYYLALDNQKMLRPLYTGLRKTINVNTFQSLKIPIPPRTEQDQIVRFLDWKVSLINRLIGVKRREVKLIEDIRRAIINKTVTRGLCNDNDNGMKKIPLKRCLDNIFDLDHYMPSSIDKGFPYVMTGDLKKLASEIDFDSCKQISEDDYNKLSKKSKSHIGDIIFARYATIGTVCYVDVEVPFITSYSCVTLSPNEIATGKYIYYFLQSESFANDIQQYVKVNTQGNIGKEAIKRAYIYIPALKEQNDITRYLDDVDLHCTSLERNKEQQLNNLQELKTRLIADTVTGKIDVRNIEIPDYEFVGEESQAEEKFDAEGSDNGE